MKTTPEALTTAIQTLRDLNEDFAEANDPAIRLRMWQAMEGAMKFTKAAEIEMRKAVFAAYFKHDKGTENIDLGQGYKLKGVAELNYNLDKTKVDDVLDGIEKMGERGAIIVETLVKYKPELSLTEYKKLAESDNQVDKNALALIQSVITTSPGSPTLTIVPPAT